MGNEINASDIAIFLKEELIGENITILKPCKFDKFDDGGLCFTKKRIPEKFALDKPCLILCPKDTSCKPTGYSQIRIQNPRLAFAKAANRFFNSNRKPSIHPTAIIGENCLLDPTIIIGSNCIIGNNVSIKFGSVLNHNLVIGDNTIIGSNCYLKSGSIIGEDGFGFDFEEDGTPFRIPHIGKVEIGNNVEIGAKNTIARGTFESTVIKDFVKTDDQVHIAHNCIINKNTVIAACAELSGGVIIGQNCWVGPNCSIIQKVIIGNNTTLGIGAVVTNDVKPNTKLMGLEAVPLRELVKIKKILYPEKC